MRAFSLIEVMLVVAIAGIMTALSIASLSGTIRQERARGEIAKAIDVVERARDRARVQVCPMVIDVDPPTASIRIGPDPLDADVPCRALPTETVRLNASLVTLSQFNVGAVPVNPLVLNTDGGFASPARAKMALVSSTGQTRTLELWPAIGTVRLQ